MAYYEIVGKWCHREYSEGFSHVVSARTPRAAIVKFAKSLDGMEEDDNIEWDYLPRHVGVGQLDPEPTFWFSGDQMYKVRHVSQVKPQVVECPECHGSGVVDGFVPMETV